MHAHVNHGGFVLDSTRQSMEIFLSLLSSFRFGALTAILQLKHTVHLNDCSILYARMNVVQLRFC